MSNIVAHLSVDDVIGLSLDSDVIRRFSVTVDSDIFRRFSVRMLRRWDFSVRRFFGFEIFYIHGLGFSILSIIR